MAITSALEQRNRLALNQARRAPTQTSANSDRTLSSPSDRSAALRMAQSLATGKRDTNASLDKQLIGEAGARLGQLAGAYVGGVGAVVGKRLGRVAGENWKIVLIVTLIWLVLPYLFLAIGALMIIFAVAAYTS
jgi:hypothetical protein